MRVGKHVIDIQDLEVLLDGIHEAGISSYGIHSYELDNVITWEQGGLSR